MITVGSRFTLALLATIAVMIAQEQGTPEAHGQGPQTATLVGIVTRDDGRPIRGAIVKVSAGAGRYTPSRITMTGRDGTFRFDGVSAGRYEVSASKTGFVTLAFGQRLPSDAVPPMVVGPRLEPYRADFVLPAPAVFAGVVLDEYGEPASGLTVTPMRIAFQGGRRELMSAARGVTTNDIGEFRIASLPAGEFFLQVTGRVGLGETPTASDGYAPTYYPGVDDPQLAQPIKAELGKTKGGLVLSLVSARLASISGHVVTVDGRAFSRGIVTVRTRRGAQVVIATTSIQHDGRFAVKSVPQGEYVLQAISEAQQDNGLPVVSASVVRVMWNDLADVVIAGVDFGIVRGRLAWPGGIAPSASTVNRVRVGVHAAEQDGWLEGLDLSRPVEPDGAFVVPAPPGDGRIVVVGLPEGFVVSEIRLNDEDVTDLLQVSPGQTRAGLEVRVVADAPTLSGTVTDEQGMKVPHGFVVVFPENRARWSWQSRFITVARLSSDGEFQSRPLPPGQYVAVAVSTLRPGEEFSSDFLESVRPHGHLVDLFNGRPAAVALRLAHIGGEQ